VTLTHPEMTRFIMSIRQAADLVLNSAGLARGGEVFVTKMPVLCIQHLAEVMIEELAPKYGHNPSGIEVREIGIRPGEKLYEELMSSEETRRTMELEDYFAVLPAFRGYYKDVNYDYPGVISQAINEPYVSSMDDTMTHAEIKQFLELHTLLDVEGASQEGPVKQFWPGDEKRAE